MTRADNTINLRAAADKRDAATRHTIAVIEELARTGAPVSVAVVAHSAGVSRSWLYEQPDLLADINRLRERASAVPIPAKHRATEESTRQRLDAARTEIERLRAENTMLREQVAPDPRRATTPPLNPSSETRRQRRHPGQQPQLSKDSR